MPFSEPLILQILMRWRTRISAAVWLHLRDAHASEDIFQNVVIKAMTHEMSFENESALLSWALISARREAIDWIRRNHIEKKFLSQLASEMLESDWLRDEDSKFGSRADALQACLERAPLDARRMLRLRYFEGLSCGDVADQMGIGLQTVYKRLSRLHQSLRLCIETNLGRVDSTLQKLDPQRGTQHEAS